MAFCNNCGAQLSEGKKFCNACGSPVETAAQPPQNQPPPQNQYQQPQQFQPQPPLQNQSRQDVRQGVDKFVQLAQNTADETGSMDPADIEKNKVMGGLAYFIFFLPLIACPESKYGRFHANQGLVYLLMCVAGGIVSSVLSVLFLAVSWRLWWFSSLISFVVWLAIIAAGVIGLINGFSGKAKELPFIGKFRIIK